MKTIELYSQKFSLACTLPSLPMLNARREHTVVSESGQTAPRLSTQGLHLFSKQQGTIEVQGSVVQNLRCR